MNDKKGSLRRRIILTIVTGISIMLLIFGVVSFTIVQKSIEDSLSKKLSIARLIKSNVDTIIKDNINRLYDVSLSGKVDLQDNDFGPEREAVKIAYRYSLFTDGVFLLDRTGNVLVHYPDKVRETALNVLSVEPISRTLAQGRPVVSNVYAPGALKRKVLYILVPLKDKSGNFVGAACGEIDPTNPLLSQRLGLIDMGKGTFIDVVDFNGVVISSSVPSHILTQCNRDRFFTTMIQKRSERVATCHFCHESRGMTEKIAMALAFVPLEMAPWGVAIQEPKKEIFAPAVKLKVTFVTLGLIFIGTALILTIGISRSIVDPLKDLIRGAGRIAMGDLSQPITPQGSDEIGTLSKSFETMRVKLIESMESIRRHAQLLEDRVRERTRQIHESQMRSEVLLKKVITSQEDERRRIARGLHDTTLQDLSAALMRIDICRLHPDGVSAADIGKTRQIVLNAYEGVIGIIQNLRPSLLDDLGLSAAIKSLLDKHLGEKGTGYFMHTRGKVDKRIRPAAEITIFRIVQEAILNAVRHAKAENVFVLLEGDDHDVLVEIEDDGEGFSLHSIFHQTTRDGRDRRGLGLLGMKERAILLEGKLDICSQPGVGTKIQLKVPLMPTEVLHAEKEDSYRG